MRGAFVGWADPVMLLDGGSPTAFHSNQPTIDLPNLKVYAPQFNH